MTAAHPRPPDLPPRPPNLVVFDCDGTLLDSERVTRDGMRTVLEEMGHPLDDEFFHGLVGGSWDRTRARLVEAYRWLDTDVDRYRAGMARVMPQLMADPGLVFPDVVEVLDHLRAADVPVAVCTSSSRVHLDRVLRLEGLAGRAVATVAREDVVEHKPSPVPYRAAVAAAAASVGRRLAPGRCVVVEDSSMGVTAGVAAGAHVVAVDRGQRQDLSAAHRVVQRLGPTDVGL